MSNQMFGVLSRERPIVPGVAIRLAKAAARRAR